MLSVTNRTVPVNVDPRALTFNAWALARGVDPFQLGERDDYESLERLYSMEDDFDDECQAALDAEVSARSPAHPAATDAASEREQEEHRAWCVKEGAQLIAAKRWNVAPGDRILLQGGDWIHVPQASAPVAAHGRRQLVIGSNPEVAQKVIDEHLPGAIVDEGEVWLQNAAGLWCTINPDDIARWTYEWDGAEYLNPEGKARAWKANATNSVLADIHKKLSVRNFFADAPRGVPFSNGFLDTQTRALVPLKDARCKWVLPFAYERGAARKSPPKRWSAFVRSIWGSDTEGVALLHQILGYLLSGRTDLQKIFLFIGPPRGGKGTVFRLLKRLFKDQAGAFKVNRLENEFGLACLLGKRVAYDQDVRASTSHLRNVGQVVERLLGISGEDEQNIPRKNREDLILTMGVRLLLGSNPPFGLADVTGALATRLIVLTFPESFLGREETDLDDALAAELPAIVDLALDGLDALNAQGRFIEPKSSQEERRAVERIANPMLGFLEDRCELGAGFQNGCGDLFNAASAWRQVNGHKNMSAGAFAEFLRARGIRKERPYVDGKRGPERYVGIRLIPLGE